MANPQRKTAYQGFASIMAGIDPELFGPESGDDTTPCADCHRPYYERMGTYWLTDDAMWAQVVGDDTIALCPSCFTDRAFKAGVVMHWQAVRDEDTP